MEKYFGAAAHSSLFLCAVMFSTWFGGVRSGMLATLLCVLSFAYILPPANSFAVEITQLPRILLFAFSALVIVSLIGKQKHSAELIKRSEEDLRTIFAILPAGISILDKDGKIIEMNSALHAILGMSIQGLLAGEYTQRRYFHADGTPMGVEEFPSSRAIKEQREILDTEIGVVKENGMTIWTLVSAAPLPGSRSVAVTTDITERKQTVEALRSSESNFRTLAHKSLQGIAIFQDQKIVYANPAEAGILGYTVEELMLLAGEEFFALVHPLDRTVARERARKRKAGEEVTESVDLRILRKDGAMRWIHSFNSSINYNGKPAVLTTSIDITERKQAEEELNKFFRATEQSPDNVFITNRSGVIEYVNAAFVELTGYEKEEAIGNTPRILRSGIHDKKFYDNLWATINHGGTFRSVFTNRKQNGAMYLEDKTISPLRDQQGNITHFVSTGRDITEQVHSEKVIIASEKKYRNLVDTTTIGVFQAAPDGQLVYVNEGFARMSGVGSLHELSSPALQKVCKNPRDFTRLVETLKVKGKAEEFEAEFLTRDGSVRTVMMSATLNDGLISGVCIDITGRKNVEIDLHATEGRLRLLSHRLLEIQENERRQLARELHDEIGQILTATKIDLDVIRRTKLPDELNQRLNDDISMLDTCLREVRNLSLELRPSILDDLGLVAALRWQLERFQQRVGFAGNLYTDGISERLDPAIETTCFRIAQEALTNIAKHAKAHHVEIEMKRRPSELTLTIHDDGDGFDIERATADAMENRSFGILGMQERASLFGGSFEFKSAIAKGTTVSVRLPI